MGLSEDLIQRLRNGGDRPASRQGPAPRSFADLRSDPSKFSSPLLGNSGLTTPLRPRVVHDISRPTTQRRGLDDPFLPSTHLTPPLSSSPPSRRQINFYDPDHDRNANGLITFADFSSQPLQIPATPVHQLSSNIGRFEHHLHESPNALDGYGTRHSLFSESASQSQIPSPPIEDSTAADYLFFEPAQRVPANEGDTPQLQQVPESEDEYAVDDQWFESAMAEVDLDRIQSKSSQKQHSLSAPMQSAEPAPERTITRSPYFPASSQPPQTQQLGQLRSSSRLSNTSSSVTFPKRPGSGLQMRFNAATPPVLTPTPHKAFAEGQQSQTTQLPKPRVGSGLVPISELDSSEEARLFSFEHFNKMQSAVFEAAYRSDENLVVSAPTGSGKTTVFELAFLRMRSSHHSDRPLAIYMSPTKALCSERANDWSSRLGTMGISCLEFTGDTDFSALYNRVRTVDLVVTTPEKWDSVTRRTSMNRMLNRLQLVMIDEVHTLHEAPRGATLEVVVSRTKSRGDAVRFVAVSATAPNIDDIARWIGNSIAPHTSDQDSNNPVAHMPKARVFKFGEEMRPVPLKKITIGYDCGNGNKFAFDSRLDKELFPILTRYGEQRPILVFCATRKGCQATATKMAKQFEDALNSGQALPWDHRKNERLNLKDESIQALTKHGVAVHHAGLDHMDRREIEQAFKNSKLHLLVATSTLAVGVNLPAHLVVIKGTSMWNGQGFREYSDIDLQQMMGRAGRPQYDTSGTVVVMCERAQVSRYQQMLDSRMVLESCLHENLTEHINSEIGLGTITSLREAQDWLKRSFLYIRIQQNPKHYVNKVARDRSRTWDETLESYVEKALDNLESQDLVSNEEDEDYAGASQRRVLRLTPMGKIMAHNFVSYDTMCNIMTMEPDADLRSLLEILAGSEEFSSLRIRQGDKAMLNKLRVSDDIRFRLGESVKTYADKVFLHLQIIFGNVSLDKFATKAENGSPMQTQMAIYNSAPRIAKAILLVATEKEYGGASRAALELVRTVNGMAWEDSATIFRQIDQIGPKSISVLDANGITSWDKLLALDASRLEMWLNRQTPFGFEVLSQAKQLPRFYLTIGLDNGEERKNPDPAIRKEKDGWPVVRLRVTVVCRGVYNTAAAKKTTKTSASKRGRKSKKRYRTKDSYQFSILFVTSDHNRFVDLRRIDTEDLADDDNEMIVNVKLCSPTESIIAIAGIEEKAGLTTTFEYKPRVPRHMFPTEEELRRRHATDRAKNPSDPEAELSQPSPSSSQEDCHSPAAKATARKGRWKHCPPATESEEEVDELASSSSSGEELIDLTARKRRKTKSKSPNGSQPPKRSKNALSAAARKAILENVESVKKPVRLCPTWATRNSDGGAKGVSLANDPEEDVFYTQARAAPAKRPRLRSGSEFASHVQ